MGFFFLMHTVELWLQVEKFTVILKNLTCGVANMFSCSCSYSIFYYIKKELLSGLWSRQNSCILLYNLRISLSNHIKRSKVKYMQLNYNNIVTALLSIFKAHRNYWERWLKHCYIVTKIKTKVRFLETIFYNNYFKK
jgi:hypothetical protein